MAIATALTEAATTKHVQVRGINLRYCEYGEGPALFMLHGGGPGASGWSNFRTNIGPLAEGGYRCLAVDMPNYGESDTVLFTDENRIEGWELLKELMQVLGIEQASFIGNSLGGGNAIQLAIRNPELVDKLVLIGSTGIAVSYFHPMPTQGHQLLQAAHANPTLETMRALANCMLYEGSLISDEALLARVEAARRHLPARQEQDRQRAALAASGQRSRGGDAPLNRVRARTLVVWGREDRVNPLDMGFRLMGGIPESRLHVFQRCGHWVQLEHSDEFNRLVLQFLSL